MFTDRVVNTILERLMIIFYSTNSSSCCWMSSERLYACINTPDVFAVPQTYCVFAGKSLNLFCVNFTFLLFLFLFSSCFLFLPFNVFCFHIPGHWEVLLPLVVKQVIASKQQNFFSFDNRVGLLKIFTRVKKTKQKQPCCFIFLFLYIFIEDYFTFFLLLDSIFSLLRIIP